MKYSTVLDPDGNRPYVMEPSPAVSSISFLSSSRRSCTSESSPPLAHPAAGLAFNLLGHAPFPPGTPLFPYFRASVRPFAFSVRRVLGACKPVRPFQRFVFWRIASCRAPPYLDRHSFRLDAARIYHSRFGVGQFYEFCFLCYFAAPSSRGRLHGFSG